MRRRGCYCKCSRLSFLCLRPSIDGKIAVESEGLLPLWHVDNKPIMPDQELCDASSDLDLVAGLMSQSIFGTQGSEALGPDHSA